LILGIAAVFLGLLAIVFFHSAAWIALAIVLALTGLAVGVGGCCIRYIEKMKKRPELYAEAKQEAAKATKSLLICGVISALLAMGSLFYSSVLFRSIANKQHETFFSLLSDGRLYPTVYWVILGVFAIVSGLKFIYIARKREVRKSLQLYILLIPAFLSVIIFAYLPIPGIVMAFMDFDIFKQFSSPFIGLGNFIQIFTMHKFAAAIWNTFYLGFLTLLITIPLPIMFAIMLNELRKGFFKRFVQTVSYLPYFFSWITVIGLATILLAPYGTINDILSAFGMQTRILFLGEQWFFIPNVLLLTVWKTTGWSTIMYLAALTAVDTQLYDSAAIDGCGRLKQIIHITMPGILPTIMILLIFTAGGLMNSNFELIYGLQNPLINFDVISTLVYSQGIETGKYGISTALGLFLSVISLALLLITDRIAYKVSKVGLY